MWKNFITLNKADKELDDNAALVTAYFKQTATNDAFVKLMTENTPLTMISKPVMGDTIQISAFHSLFGSTLLQKKQSILALTGSHSGAMIELAPTTFPSFSTSAFVPDLDEILNCITIEDVEKIQTSTTKKKLEMWPS